MEAREKLERMVTNAHTVRILRGSTADMIQAALRELVEIAEHESWPEKGEEVPTYKDFIGATVLVITELEL